MSDVTEDQLRSAAEDALLMHAEDGFLVREERADQTLEWDPGLGLKAMQYLDRKRLPRGGRRSVAAFGGGC